ncbi:Uncharacterised protein [Lederbergia lenta]|uniref:Uncharacterized protein n=1 Tax=Lederbergia lenta TaxID=1467 RepID=A0A2X4WB30_LEDLE|nr:Uncharacterised protein [Lederbergia lenta]
MRKAKHRYTMLRFMIEFVLALGKRFGNFQ